MAAEEPPPEKGRPGVAGWHWEGAGARGDRDAASGQLAPAIARGGEARGLSVPLHVRKSLPLSFPCSLRSEGKKYPHLARRWGGKSEGERGEEEEAEKGREGEKGRVHEHYKVTNMAPPSLASSLQRNEDAL